ncbi:hypothetical protein IV203_037334 [Nitzschia inconspicua]|uniref:ShKT domain-containing protein n=1 Tax=Nitzschia inconspicua TaxID=303405 RepID=A0A9K3LL56_9STRA|nr:hypothetical protein IV203_037334 [Nitzschia inconspicua]
MIGKISLVVMIAGPALAGESHMVADTLLRGSTDRKVSRSLLHPPKNDHHSSYLGCLSYSSDELSTKWTFSGQAANCSWTHTGSNNGGSDGGGGSNGGSGSSGNNGGSSNGDSGSSGNSGGSSNGGSGSGGSGSSNGGSGSGGSGSSNGGSGSGGSGGVDDGGNIDSNGGGNNGSSGGTVVTNEDVSQGNSNYDPMTDFDVTQCETYENLWLWDLSLSCNASNINASLRGCNCSFAAELMESAYLSCEDAARCPRKCPICSTCMSILGCDIYPENPLISEMFSSNFFLLFYVIAAAAALVIIMIAVYYSRNRRHTNGDLKKSLMDGPKSSKDATRIDLDNCMYIDDEKPFQPPSRHYCTETIQQVNTMSTSSASRFFDEKNQPYGGESLLGERQSSNSNDDDLSASFRFPAYPIPQTATGLQVVDTLAKAGEDIVSPISSPGCSLAGAETNDDFENEPSGLDKELPNNNNETGHPELA